MDAGSRSPEEPGHAGDARARDHRPEQPDRRGLLDRDAPRAARFRRRARPPDPRRRGLRRPRLRRPGRAVRQARSRRGDHLVLEPVEGLPRARLAHRLDGVRPLAAPERRDRGGEEAGRRPPVQHRADAVRDRRRVDRRPVAPTRVPHGAEGARRPDGQPPARDAGRHLRGAERGVLRDAAGRAAAGQDRRRLRQGAAARDRRTVRLRIRVRLAG